MQVEDPRLRLRPRADAQPASEQGRSGIDIIIPSPTCLHVENALLSTAQVASHLCGIPFKPTETANEILLNIVERRDPGVLLRPDGSGGGADLQESRSANSSKRLREDFNPFSTQVVRTDPYLNYLLENVSSSGPTSLRRGQDHRTAIHAGDVVVYEESNGNQVMAAVMGFKAVRSNPGSAVNMRIFATRLYGSHELFRIMDSLQSYRAAVRLQHVDFESQDHAQVLKDGDDFKKGLAAYTTLKSRFSEHFNDFEEQQHKIIQVALSDFITVISPDNVHDVLRLVLSTDILENVSPSNGTLPSPSNVSKLLHCKAVVYTHVLNTTTWILRPIIRSEDDMIVQILPAVCQSLREAPPALVSCMLGALRRQIFSSISRLARGGFSDPRACVFEPTCSFSLFAYVVYVTQEPTSVEIAWKKASKSWEARFKGAVALEAQLGVGWGNFQNADGSFVQVIPESEVLLCYTHSHPDRLRVTVRVTRGQEGGGSVQLLPGDQELPLSESFLP
jgi:hypothetical protein